MTASRGLVKVLPQADCPDSATRPSTGPLTHTACDHHSSAVIKSKRGSRRAVHPPSARHHHPYTSSLREAQAAATRAAVLAAAATLFARDGYLRTTMRDIAAEAGVSVETVYAQGSKQSLLLAGVDLVLTEGREPDALMARTAFEKALAAPSAVEVIAEFVEAVMEVADRVAPLLVAFEDAASADSGTAELWSEAEQQRKKDYHRAVVAVSERRGLRDDLDVETLTEGMWATFTPRLTLQLRSLGWSRRHRVDWVTRALVALLLPPATPRQP